MIITSDLKQKVVDALTRDAKERNMSQAEYSRYIANLLCIPFSPAAMSSIKHKEKRNFLADGTWLRLAKHFNLIGDNSWVTAETHTYKTMFTYLEMCKKHGIWRMMCDHASFGKTYAAEEFAKKNKGSVFYIHCGDNSTKAEFITELARQFGISREGTYNQLWRDVTDELLLIQKPLLILDEFGDVHDSIITLMKSLYNKANMGSHNALGVLHIGADNLQKRMIDGRRLRKQSYAEYWSRFGDDILTLNMVNPDIEKPAHLQISDMLKNDATLITDLNLPKNMVDFRDDLIKKAVKRQNLRVIRDDINIKSELVD